MVQYDYKCPKDHIVTIERLMTESEGNYTCLEVECSEALTRIYTANPVLFMGDGFYSTSSK